MRPRLARLGVGDWLILVGAVGLLVDLFVGSWFSYANGWYAALPPASVAGLLGSRAGWQGLAVLGPVAAVIGVVGIVTFGAQAGRRSPAVPVVLTTLLAPVAALLVLALAVRTLIAPPDGAIRRVGGSALHVDTAAYVGLGFSVVLAVGLFVSLRREGIAAADAPVEIETIKLDPAPGT